MKRVILSLIIIMVMASVCFAQNGLINQNQIQQHIVNCVAGENLTAGDVVSLINSYGTVTAKKNNLAVNTSPNGAESVFNSAATTAISSVALDSTRFLVAYKDSDTYPKAIVGTVSGSTIAWGSESSAFENINCGDMSAVKIDTDKVFVFYGDSSNSKARGIVLSISTATISNGTPVDILTTAYCFSNQATLLEANKVLIAYKRQTTNYGDAKIVTISDTIPTPYPAAGTDGTHFNEAATSYPSVSALSATSAIVAYQDSGNSSYGTAQVLSISGTTITPGTEYVFLSSTAIYIGCCSLSSTSAAIIYRNNGSTRGEGVALSVNGAEITYGTPTIFTGPSDALYNYCSKIDSTHFLASFYNNSNAAKTMLGTVAGTVLAFGTPVSFNAANTAYISCVYVGNQKSAVVYQDTDNGNYGTAVVNTWATSDYSAIRGLCTTTTTSGNSAPILLSGVLTTSGLTTGSQYYVAADYSLSTAPVSLAIMKNSSTQTGEIYVGTAKSATELVVGVDYK